MAGKKALIVAYGRGREIGKNGDMPWVRELPADLRHFRELTVGKSAIMGYKTFLSIAKPLPQRENIVVTSHAVSDGFTAVRSLEEAYEVAQHEPIIIGGAQLYATAMSGIDTIYATEIDANFAGSDTFFPAMPSDFEEYERISHAADERNAYSYDFVTYARIKAQKAVGK